MKRLTRSLTRSLILAAAAIVLIPAVASAPAIAASGKGVKQKQVYKYKARQQRCGLFGRACRRGPQVRGFTASVGGYSFVFQDTLRVDPDNPPPVDFGPYLDGYRLRGGVIDTAPYP